MLVTIHGHFYQPPRENAWTGEVPRQESARPFHDWNERITNECYGPNGRSRVLDPRGRITAIVNNYTHLSFDFGPTLLRDLERRYPLVYRRILEADRESVLRHGGHGSGMAQAYNHMILPLASYRDKQTQVLWGLRDFEHRFGRRSEGIWFPETACDAETMAVAAESGVRFTLLAPHQALRFRKLGANDWIDVRPESPIDTTRPYRCFVNGRDRRGAAFIDIFFYDPGLSVAVSFEHLLRGAEGFASRLEQAGHGLGPLGLVHLATDGEIYGHHEPFADMCLAYLIHEEAPHRNLRLVNYPERLAMAAPEYEVELNYTETGEGTAWSCSHGVGRWTRDCGCSTGAHPGWNQRWRAPLRRGLDAIRDQIQSAFLARTSPYLKDPWAARDEYIDVLLRPETREEFLARNFLSTPDAPTREMVLSLLEAVHQAMLMYTSCAWFFDDISGLEVQQNLGYAARACELAQPYVPQPLERLLLRHLEQARSNLPDWKNGAEIYRRLVSPRRVGPEHAAARAIFESAILERPLNREVYLYKVEGSVRDDGGPEREENEEREESGQLCVCDPRVEQEWCWSFLAPAGSLLQREVLLEPAVDPKASVAPFRASIRLRDFAQSVREEIARAALRKTLSESAERIRAIYEDTRGPMGLLIDFGVDIPEIHRSLASFVLGQRFSALASELTRDQEPIPHSWWEEVEGILEENRALGLSTDSGPLARELSERIGVLLEQALAETDRKGSLVSVVAAYETWAHADRLKLPLPRTWLEPRAYELVLRFREDLTEAREPGRTETEESAEQVAGITALRLLAGHANLELDAILKDAQAQIEADLALPSNEGRTPHAKG